MDFRETKTADRQTKINQFAAFDGDDELVKQRLNQLLAINAETARQKAMYRSDREKLEAELMKSPLGLEKTFSYLGLMLGAFPPAALFVRFALDTRVEPWVFGVMFIINLISAVVGFFSGKIVGKVMRPVENFSWPLMTMLLPLVGFLWGAVAGAAGGVVFFVVGAFFGAFIGGLVGAAALPFFTLLHRLLKKGESLELKHFLPLAFGVTLIICGFILGF